MLCWLIWRCFVCCLGTIVDEDRIIRFEDVPIVTPNGDVLVRSMSFEVCQPTRLSKVGR